MGNIRHLEHYLANIWDWSFLNDCFGATNIRVGDIDGFVERRGHFLYLEVKRLGSPIEKGQAISLNALARQKNSAVLVIWGPRNRPKFYKWWGEKYAVHPADEETIRKLVARWFEQVEADEH